MANNNFDPARVIYTPDEVAALAKERVEYIQSNAHRTLKFFIPGLDDYIAPLLPGEQCMVIAQTSNYKSSFAESWEFCAAKQLELEGRADEIIIHVSTEESVEQQAFRLLAREMGASTGDISRGKITNWKDFTIASIKVGNVSIYRIGHSLMRPKDLPRLHMSNVIKALDYLQNKLTQQKLKFAGIFFDYLQAFPFDDAVKRASLVDQRRLQVREDIYRMFDCGIYFDCPTVTLSQAKQTLDGAISKDMYIPGIYDGSEAKETADRPDRVLSLWMPKTMHPVNTWLKFGSTEYPVLENLLWIKACKQRGGLPAGRVFPCLIDYDTNRILQWDKFPNN